MLPGFYTNVFGFQNYQVGTLYQKLPTTTIEILQLTTKLQISNAIRQTTKFAINLPTKTRITKLSAPGVSCIVRQLSIKLPFKLETCAFVSRWTTPHPRCRERRIFDCSLETYCVSQSKPYWQVSQLFECRQRFRLGACRRQRRRRDIVNACSPEKLNTWSAC